MSLFPSARAAWRRVAIVVSMTIALLASVASDARACAVCGASDAILPTNGAETPFRGRTRATVDARAASFRSTTTALAMAEYRAEAGVAHAPVAAVLLGLQMPVLRREVTVASSGGDAGSEATAVPGDLEARVTYLAWTSAASGLRRKFGLVFALKAPTGPIQRDPAGRYIQPDLQPGCGSVMPIAGAWYSLGRERWSILGSVTIFFPMSVRGGPHPGDSLRGSITGQIQPLRWLAGRLGVHGRWDGAGDTDGLTDTRSGGAAAFVAPEIVLSPTTDLVISAGASFPFAQAMRGYRTTAPVAMLGIGLDF